MKRNLMLICLALAIVLASMAFVACDNTTTPDNSNGNYNSYESATYTVTFNVNSNDFKLTNSVLKDVPAGSTIEAPKDSSGNTITPYKIGYEFQFWSADGSSAFNFGIDTINAPTTLTAIYTNKEYKHELSEEYDEKKSGYFYVNQKLVYKKDGTYSIERDDNIGASMKEGTSLTLTYAQTSTLDCPSFTDPNVTDRFLFWFYMKDGKPVQLSKEAGKTDTTVVTREKYSTASQLNIFAMFESTLPKVTVTFEGADDAEKTKEFPVNGTISASDVPSVSKSGYVFSNWYYETEDEDGVIEEHDFSIADDEQGTIGTSLYSACALGNYFTPAELTLKPRYIKQISIANRDEYMTKLYNVLHGGSEDDIKELLTADIKLFASSIDFNGAELEPLFDAEHVFVGTIDGGSYKQSGELDKKAQLTNIRISGAAHASLFGYISGTIKNIDVVLTLSPSKQAEAYADKIIIGGIASENKGSIENCTVKATLDVSQDDVLNAVVFGGICALNNGSVDSNTGYIYQCSAELTIGSLKCESLMLGGIAAQSNAASTIASCKSVKVTADSIVCADDGNSNNGRSFAKLGGITAINGGSISKSNVEISIAALSSLEEAYFGGISAECSGSVKESYAQALLTASVGGGVSQSVCIGGLVGRNEGYILNAYCNSTINVTALRKNANIALGGIVGSNVSDKKDTTSSTTQGIGAINSAYSTGSIALTVDEQTSGVSAYVGGLVGRNTQSKISSCFTTVDIVVVNQNGTNRIGHTFGSAEKNLPTQTTLIYYAEDSALKLNGKDVEFDPTQLSGSFTANKTDFEQEGFLSTKGMNFDDKADGVSVWIVSGGSLPTLRYFQG